MASITRSDRTAALRPETPAGAADELGLVGTIIDGRYLVEARIGAGGFGVVYRARHVRFDSPVAIKVLLRSSGLEAHRRELGGSPDEGRLLFKLAPLHSTFVHVFEAGVVRRPALDPRPYLAMEWLDGVTLKALFELRRQGGLALSLPIVLHLLDSLAQGLGVAHARRVAHRDLKPANVFLTVTDGQVVPKLLDFGLAKQGGAMADAHDDTAHVSAPFTPAYGAPEQWDRTLGATGAWTDVYALALICVELLAGQRWSGELTTGDLMRATLDGSRRPTPRAIGVDLSGEIDAVFAKALAVEPRRRFPDAGSFWRALCCSAAWAHPGTPVLATTLGLESAPSSRGTTPRELVTSAVTASQSSAVPADSVAAARAQESAPFDSSAHEALTRSQIPLRRPSGWLVPFALMALGAAASVGFTLLRATAPASAAAVLTLPSGDVSPPSEARPSPDPTRLASAASGRRAPTAPMRSLASTTVPSVARPRQVAPTEPAEPAEPTVPTVPTPNIPAPAPPSTDIADLVFDDALATRK